MPNLTIRSGRTVAAATLLAAILATLPLHGAGAEQVSKPMQLVTSSAKNTVDSSEARIKELHDKLQITPAQEELWGAVG